MAKTSYAHQTISQILQNLGKASEHRTCCWDPWNWKRSSGNLKRGSGDWKWNGNCAPKPVVNRQTSFDPWLYWLRTEELEFPKLCGSAPYHTYYIGKAETLGRLHDKMRSDYKAAHLEVPVANAPCTAVDVYPALGYYTWYRTEVCMLPYPLTSAAKKSLDVAKKELAIAEKVLFAACVLAYGLKPAGNAMGTLGPVRAVLEHSSLHPSILKLVKQLSL